MTRSRLTDRQQKVLDFIRESAASKGYPPTWREIAEHMGIRSTNGVNDHLKALVRKGYLVSDHKKSRTMRPTDEHTAASLTHGVRRLAAVLGVDLGFADDPLPADWLRRCIEAAQRRAA